MTSVLELHNINLQTKNMLLEFMNDNIGHRSTT